MKNGMIPSMGCGPLRTNPISLTLTKSLGTSLDDNGNKIGNNNVGVSFKVKNNASITIGTSSTKTLATASVSIGPGCRCGNINYIGASSAYGAGMVSIGVDCVNNQSYGSGGISIGYTNTISGENGSVALGRNNTMTFTGNSMATVIGNDNLNVVSHVFGYNNSGGGYLLGYYIKLNVGASFGYANGCLTPASTGDAQLAGAVLSCKTIPATLTSNIIVGGTTTSSNPSLYTATNTIKSGIINIHGIKSDGSLSAHYIRKICFQNINKNVSSIDITNNLLNFSTNHGIITGDELRISSSISIPGGITSGLKYYALAISSTSISIHTALPPGPGNIVDITSVGSGIITVNSSKLNYIPEAIGADFSSGTLLNISLVTNGAFSGLDYITISVTGTSGDTWRWLANYALTETLLGT